MYFLCFVLAITGPEWQTIATNLDSKDQDLIHLFVITTPEDNNNTLYIDSLRVSRNIASSIHLLVAKFLYFFL